MDVRMDRSDASIVHDACAFAVELMVEVNALVQAHRDGGFAIHRKADGSLVTDVDLLIERTLRERIRLRWPEHSIEGEEGGLDARSGEFRWVIDPIDGTMSFRHGVPLFGTILALRQGNRSVVGVINLPGLDRCYSAGRGLGAHVNGRRLQLADVNADAIPGEIIATGDRRQFERAGLSEGFDALMKSHPWVRTYADCFGHCLAVEGAVGAMCDPGINPWDLAATEVLVEEAGGVFDCRPSRRAGGFDVTFGKPTVVVWVLDQIRLAHPS